MQWFNIWTSGGATCIRWRHLHYQIVLVGLPYWHYQQVPSWYLHQPKSHQLSLNKFSQLETPRPMDRTPGIPGSDKHIYSSFEIRMKMGAVCVCTQVGGSMTEGEARCLIRQVFLISIIVSAQACCHIKHQNHHYHPLCGH